MRTVNFRLVTGPSHGSAELLTSLPAFLHGLPLQPMDHYQIALPLHATQQHANPSIAHSHLSRSLALGGATVLSPFQPIQDSPVPVSSARFVPSFSITAVKRNCLLGSKAELFTW